MRDVSCTFARLLSLPENRSAILAARSIGRRLVRHHAADDTSNPLILLGPPGVGKTLLIRKLVRFVSSRSPAGTCKVLRSADLATADASARRAILIVIEDCQFAAGAEARPFIRLLDEAQAWRTQIVVTGNRQIFSRPPVGLDRPLRDRLLSGLVVSISPYGPASHLRLLDCWCRDIEIEPTALFWLVEALPASTRVLRQAARRLRKLAITGRQLDLETVAGEMADLICRERATLHDITVAVANGFGVSDKAIRSRSRNKQVVAARHVTAYLARRISNHSYRRIAAFLGDRDRSSIRYAARKIARSIEVDGSLARMIAEITADITGQGETMFTVAKADRRASESVRRRLTTE